MTALLPAALAVAFAAVGSVLAALAVRSRRKAARLARRDPVDSDNLPKAGATGMQPWERAYRGHRWPDPRPSDTPVSAEVCLVYSELAETSANWHKVTGALLVWATGGAAGGLIASLWSMGSDLDWAVIGGLTGVGILAAWGVVRQGQDARHWEQVAGAYRSRAARIRRARHEGTEPARRFTDRLAAAWAAFRR